MPTLASGLSIETVAIQGACHTARAGQAARPGATPAAASLLPQP